MGTVMMINIECPYQLAIHASLQGEKKKDLWFVFRSPDKEDMDVCGRIR